MNLLVSTNDNYVIPLTVLLQSVFDHHEEPLHIWFLWSELSEDNRAFFRDLVQDHGSDITYVPVEEAAFRDLPTKKYISRETYFRLLAAELLPEQLNRILWLDADMVVNGNLQEFYDTDLSGYTVAACPHGAVMKPTIYENCRNIGIREPGQYFNAGVMLCNLDEWRTMDIPERIRMILSEKKKMMFPGQDLTNLLFNGSVKTEDWEIYNCMTHSILPEEMPRLREKARIIHYAGFAKPWSFHDIPFADLWEHYYKETPFADRPLKRTSYAMMKKLYEKRRLLHPDEENQ